MQYFNPTGGQPESSPSRVKKSRRIVHSRLVQSQSRGVSQGAAKPNALRVNVLERYRLCTPIFWCTTRPFRAGFISKTISEGTTLGPSRLPFSSAQRHFVCCKQCSLLAVRIHPA